MYISSVGSEYRSHEAKPQKRGPIRTEKCPVPIRNELKDNDDDNNNNNNNNNINNNSNSNNNNNNDDDDDERISRALFHVKRSAALNRCKNTRIQHTCL